MAQAQPIVYAPAPSKLPPPERMFFYGMGLVAVGGAIYFAREYFLNKQSSAAADYLPYDTGTGNKTVTVKRTDAFPLKKGSTGAHVKQLQTALATIIGTDAMNQDGGIDGKFGPGTADALSKAGYGPTVDEATFSKITGTTGTGSGASTVSNPSQEAMNLYLAANSGNVSSVIGALQRIKNVADYTAVNEAFKTVTDNYTAVRKTIVTGLLDSYFSDNASAKEQIKAQFRRIGLKEDTASQKWSLSGLPNAVRDIKTIQPTYVVDQAGNRVPVRKNVILGAALGSAKGMTMFRSIDNILAAVPTQHVIYM